MSLRFPRNLLKRFLSAIVVVNALLSTQTANAQRISGPEDQNIPCVTNVQCASLLGGRGEDPRCVEAACVRGFCVKSYRTGKVLGMDPSPNPNACSISPIVCGSTGQAVLDSDPARSLAFNENRPCTPSTPVDSVCQQATCRNKVCQVSNATGAPCPDPNGDSCKKGICAAGKCSSVKVDRAQLQQSCKPTEVSECIETNYACGTSGCRPIKKPKTGAQCGSDGSTIFRAPDNELPKTFVSLLQSSPRKLYSCSTSCLLEYCGNSIIDRPDEECDGAAFRQPPPTGAKCESNCTVTKPPACTLTAVRDLKGNRITPLGMCTVRVTSTGGPTTLLTINGGQKAINTNLKFPCPLNASTTFSAVLSGPISPAAKCEATVPPACIYSFHESLRADSTKQYVYEGKITNAPSCLLNRIQQCKDWIDKGVANLRFKEDGHGICRTDWNDMVTCKAHVFRACMMYQNGYWEHGLRLKVPEAPEGSQKFLSDLMNGLHAHYLRNPKIETYPRVFSDANCEYKGWEASKGATATCGGVEYLAQSSPISLILEDGYDIEAHQAVVSFPVNLGHPEKLYTWKASSKAPLLVHDPEHNGIVTSPTQLFGNWTFGGQRVASRELGTILTDWKDGYAALASLDENGDGKISDQELKDIALWFDANQNAVAEPGEVQRLDQHGITELYFNPDQRDEGAHSITASRGFKRIVEGREMYGRSVDWFAAAAESIDPLVNHALGKESDKSSGVNQPPREEGSSKEAALNQPSGVSGIWEWRANSSTDSSLNDIPNGLLIIGETEGSGISVNSIVLENASEISTPENLVLFSLVDMGGSATRKGQGDPEIEFSSSPDKGGVSVRSKATLTNNGARLVGYSEAATTDESGATRTIRYEWNATRR